MGAIEVSRTDLPRARDLMAHVRRRTEPAPRQSLPRPLQLQRLAGNRAVARLIADRLPAAVGVQRQASDPSATALACRTVQPVPPPTTLPEFGNWADPSWMRREAAPDGLAAIVAADPSGSLTLGDTPWPTNVDQYMPHLDFVPYQLPNQSWTTRLEFRPASRLEVHGRFVGPGVHQLTAGPDAGFYVISPELSDRVRRGEAEHVDDFSYAHLLVSQQISQILYRLTSAPKPQAATAEAAAECTWRWFRSALPPMLRWDSAAGTGGLDFMWLQRQNTLAGATMRRDNEKWHSMARQAITNAREKRRYGIPTDKVGYVVVPGQSEIDQHPTVPLVQQKLSLLPTLD